MKKNIDEKKIAASVLGAWPIGAWAAQSVLSQSFNADRSSPETKAVRLILEDAASRNNLTTSEVSDAVRKHLFFLQKTTNGGQGSVICPRERTGKLQTITAPELAKKVKREEEMVKELIANWPEGFSLAKSVVSRERTRYTARYREFNDALYEVASKFQTYNGAVLSAVRNYIDLFEESPPDRGGELRIYPKGKPDLQTRTKKAVLDFLRKAPKDEPKARTSWFGKNCNSDPDVRGLLKDCARINNVPILHMGRLIKRIHDRSRIFYVGQLKYWLCLRKNYETYLPVSKDEIMKIETTCNTQEQSLNLTKDIEDMPKARLMAELSSKLESAKDKIREGMKELDSFCPISQMAIKNEADEGDLAGKIKDLENQINNISEEKNALTVKHNKDVDAFSREQFKIIKENKQLTFQLEGKSGQIASLEKELTQSGETVFKQKKHIEDLESKIKESGDVLSKIIEKHGSVSEEKKMLEKRFAELAAESKKKDDVIRELEAKNKSFSDIDFAQFVIDVQELFGITDLGALFRVVKKIKEAYQA